MNTTHDYIYAQQQMHYADIDFYEGEKQVDAHDEDLYDVFPDLENQQDEYEHPLVGYYGC